jgi:hypothetical protein
MIKPRFKQVEYHPAHAFRVKDELMVYKPSMVALDDEGSVWRTFQNDDHTWMPWQQIMEVD